MKSRASGCGRILIIRLQGGQARGCTTFAGPMRGVKTKNLFTKTNSVEETVKLHAVQLTSVTRVLL